MSAHPYDILEVGQLRQGYFREPEPGWWVIQATSIPEDTQTFKFLISKLEGRTMITILENGVTRVWFDAHDLFYKWTWPLYD